MVQTHLIQIGRQRTFIKGGLKSVLNPKGYTLKKGTSLETPPGIG